MNIPTCNGCIVANALSPGALCVPCVEAAAREAISVKLAEQAITIFNLKAENERLRDVLSDFAEHDCTTVDEDGALADLVECFYAAEPDVAIMPLLKRAFALGRENDRLRADEGNDARWQGVYEAATTLVREARRCQQIQSIQREVISLERELKNVGEVAAPRTAEAPAGRKHEVIEQLCKMMGRVWQEIDPDAHDPCDCVCRSDQMLKHYQNAGHALTFMEEAVSEAIARRDRERASHQIHDTKPNGEDRNGNDDSGEVQVLLDGEDGGGQQLGRDAEVRGDDDVQSGLGTGEQAVVGVHAQRKAGDVHHEPGRAGSLRGGQGLPADVRGGTDGVGDASHAAGFARPAAEPNASPAETVPLAAHLRMVELANENANEIQRLKSCLGEIAALGDFCEDCEPSDATVATHLTTSVVTGIPEFLCEEHAEEARVAHRKAESKGCGKQPEVVEHEQDLAVTIALAGLSVSEEKP